jgi:predicted phosphate transport protein (TIGR00153 family)
MRVLFQDFISNKSIFFDQFNNAAKNMVDMATVLDAIVTAENTAEHELMFKQINRLENCGDDITHKLNLTLDRIIFTPLRRSDIHDLAASIDDIADVIQEAGNRINLYNIFDMVAPIKQLCAIILKAAISVQTAVSLLRTGHNQHDIITACRRIKDYERQADQIYYHAVADLFLNDKDAINLIKYRDILHSLETTVNKCKTTADVLEVILINR